MKPNTMTRMSRCLAMLFALSETLLAQDAPAYQTDLAIPYREGAELTPYMRERCRLDVYRPTNQKDFTTIVWFHGGGLTEGERSIPEALMEKGIAIIAPSYRLSPKVKSPAYVEDAAAAVAWTFKNIEKLGGSPKRVFVSGHSAGGYLATSPPSVSTPTGLQESPR
jgi:acetyl esterase/lipase